MYPVEAEPCHRHPFLQMGLPWLLLRQNLLLMTNAVCHTSPNKIAPVRGLTSFPIAAFVLQ